MQSSKTETRIYAFRFTIISLEKQIKSNFSRPWKPSRKIRLNIELQCNLRKQMKKWFDGRTQWFVTINKYVCTDMMIDFLMLYIHTYILYITYWAEIRAIFVLMQCWVDKNALIEPKYGRTPVIFGVLTNHWETGWKLCNGRGTQKATPQHINPHKLFDFLNIFLISRNVINS